MIKNKKFLYLCIFIIFIYLMYLFTKNINKKNLNNNMLIEKYNNNLTYYRCSDKKIGKITDDIFNFFNINKSNINNWDIYIPCGYNFVESELKKINLDKNINRHNKFIFGINGCDKIVSKNKIWETLVNCYGRNIASKLMPESFVLENNRDMNIFNKQFNNQSNKIYIMKKNLQRKEGLKLTKNIYDILDGVNLNYKVVQKYINNLYLINGRKVNLRIYVLVVIKNNVIYFYLCKNGKCIYTNKKYNDNDLDFESNITSYHLDMNVYKENPRSFYELKKYMNNDINNNINNNINNDINNENNLKYNNKNIESNSNCDILFKNIYTNMKKICKCISKNLYQSNNIKGTISFQLFGADVIFDEDLNPYLLEMNKGPDMNPRDIIDKKMKTKVQEDMFKIVGIIPQPKNEINSFNLIYQEDK